MQVLRSTLLLTQVVEDLGLDKSDAFWTPERSSFATPVLAEKDRIFTQMGLGATEEMNDAERFQAAVKKLRNDVSVIAQRRHFGSERQGHREQSQPVCGHRECHFVGLYHAAL